MKKALHTTTSHNIKFILPNIYGLMFLFIITQITNIQLDVKIYQTGFILSNHSGYNESNLSLNTLICSGATAINGGFTCNHDGELIR
jgi:hypothetical protein